MKDMLNDLALFLFGGLMVFFGYWCARAKDRWF